MNMKTISQYLMEDCRSSEGWILGDPITDEWRYTPKEREDLMRAQKGETEKMPLMFGVRNPLYLMWGHGDIAKVPEFLLSGGRYVELYGMKEGDTLGNGEYVVEPVNGELRIVKQ